MTFWFIRDNLLAFVLTIIVNYWFENTIQNIDNIIMMSIMMSIELIKHILVVNLRHTKLEFLSSL